MGLPPKVNAVFIDDSAEDRLRLNRALSGVRYIKLQPLPPPALHDVAQLVEDGPDAVLIDYQLSGHEAGRQAATYKGSTLAAALREKLAETPILLLTRRSLFAKGRVAAARDVLGAFDDLYVKEEIYDDPEQFARDLSTLVSGYQILGENQDKNWTALRDSLGAGTEEDELLLSADPPQDVLIDKAWRVSEVARWIRKTIIAYPGVLYDPLHASVALGVTKSSFLLPSVQAFLKKALYRGAFAPTEPHFWKRRLLLRAQGLLKKAGMGDAALADFAGAWRKVRRRSLEQAVCNTSRERPAEAVCYVLAEPVMRRHSLPYHPDSRPAVMDEARVSFKAIRTSNQYDERLFPADARKLLHMIQKSSDSP